MVLILAVMMMTQERLMIAVHSIATCEATFEMTREWVKERKAFGGRVADLQTVQVQTCRLADLQTVQVLEGAV